MEFKAITLTDLFWNDIIFQYIFPLLTIKDLYQLRATSKVYRKLVEEYFNNLKSLHLHSEGFQTFNEISFKVLATCCTNIRKANFTACSWLTDDILITFFINNKHITDVNLSMCRNLTSKCLQPLIIHSKHLRTLKLNNCTWFTSGCLEALTLHQTHLENVDFSNTCIGDQTTMNRFLKKNKHLEKLHVENVQIITDESLYYIGQCCPNLKKINIRQNFHITENGIRLLLNSCKNLNMIYLRLCPSLSYKFIQEIGRQVQVDKCNVFTIVKFPRRNNNFPPDEIE